VIGLTVTTGASAGGRSSGGAFNPAVGTGPTLINAMMGGGSLAHWPIYLIGPFGGAILAALVFRMQESPA
jgi:glycerol uptake facilitator-like aquaporin